MLKSLIGDKTYHQAVIKKRVKWEENRIAQLKRDEWLDEIEQNGDKFEQAKQDMLGQYDICEN